MKKKPLTMKPEDLETLKRANQHLEHPSLAARLSNVVGTPVEVALQLLPKRWYRNLHGMAERAIYKSLRAATGTLHRHDRIPAHENFYRGLGALTGAAGGFFGWPGLVAELPVTTTLMMRAIAEIARSEGEDLDDPDSKRACVEVFALGGRAEDDDAADTGYYGVRLALAVYSRSLQAAAAERLAAGEVMPVLFRVLNNASGRFGVAVSQKTAVQMLPMVGAIGAATVNTIFIMHFQDMARHHFAIRRLERKYGVELVEAQYAKFSDRG